MLLFTIKTFATLTSTQDEMRARLEQGQNVHGLVIRALQQTSGRGQKSRDWQSLQGGSYQTLALKIDPQPQAAIAVAIGIAEVLRQHHVQAGLKWPNDIYLNHKKVAGILCEYIKGHLIIGIGVNVRNTVPEYAGNLYGFEVETVSNLVLEGVQKGLEVLHDPGLPQRFAALDILQGQPISVKVGKHIKTGIARGIDAQGCLKLEQPQKTLAICSGHIGSQRFKEV